jgi:hypothetical protein
MNAAGDGRKGRAQAGLASATSAFVVGYGKMNENSQIGCKTRVRVYFFWYQGALIRMAEMSTTAISPASLSD